MFAARLLAVVALLQTIHRIGVSYFLGRSQLRGASVEASTEGGLVIDGFYCCIINSLFFFVALLL